MKRLDREKVIKLDIPRDIWSYIINILYHLKYADQWRSFKERAARDCYFMPPVEKIEIPVYKPYHSRNRWFIEVCRKIDDVYWNSNGILAVEVAQVYIVPIKSPHLATVKEKKSNGVMLWVNAAMARNDDSDRDILPYNFSVNSSVIHETDEKPPHSTLNMPLDTIPDFVLRS